MVFIDSLSVTLLLLGFSSLTISLYFFLSARGKKDISALIVLAFIFGLFDSISGFIMSFTWPLPGAYNMLFGDPLLVLGLIMVAGAYMLYKKIDAKILSIFGFLLGVYLAVCAAGIVNFNLETGVNFLPAFGLYVMSALSALFSPLVYINAKNRKKYVYYFLFALLVITSFVAFFLGYTSIYKHLQSPP
jgi:putative membrane protein